MKLENHTDWDTAQLKAIVREVAKREMLSTDDVALINVGSVGQPRDGDPRACYTTFDGDSVVWRRVEYNVEATCQKIYKVPDLDDFLADRLREGR